jgi:protease-4
MSAARPDPVPAPGAPRTRPFLRGCLVLTGVILGFFFLLGLLARMDGVSMPGGGGKVAVVPVTGIITESEGTIELLKKYGKDADVRAVVLRIDTPGGGVGPSQEIHEEVGKLREKKPVVVSMGALAASGGYYIASAAGKIYANPGTITGSIGVIMPFVNMRGLAEKIGIRGMEVKSGPFKDAGSSLRDMTPAEKVLLQAVVDNTHMQFVRAVAEGRRLPVSKVLAVADGRILSGEQALALGLVDALGNQEDAVAEAGRLGGIRGEPEVVTPQKKKISLVELLKQEVRTLVDERLSTGPGAIEYAIH